MDSINKAFKIEAEKITFDTKPGEETVKSELTEVFDKINGNKEIKINFSNIEIKDLKITGDYEISKDKVKASGSVELTYKDESTPPTDEDKLLDEIKKSERVEALENYFEFKYNEIITLIKSGYEFEIETEPTTPNEIGSVIMQIGKSFIKETDNKLKSIGVIIATEKPIDENWDIRASSFNKKSPVNDSINSSEKIITLSFWSYQAKINDNKSSDIGKLVSHNFENLKIHYKLVK